MKWNDRCKRKPDPLEFTWEPVSFLVVDNPDKDVKVIVKAGKVCNRAGKKVLSKAFGSDKRGREQKWGRK